MFTDEGIESEGATTSDLQDDPSPVKSVLKDDTSDLQDDSTPIRSVLKDDSTFENDVDIKPILKPASSVEIIPESILKPESDFFTKCSESSSSSEDIAIPIEKDLAAQLQMIGEQAEDTEDKPTNHILETSTTDDVYYTPLQEKSMMNSEVRFKFSASHLVSRSSASDYWTPDEDSPPKDPVATGPLVLITDTESSSTTYESSSSPTLTRRKNGGTKSRRSENLKRQQEQR